uniref:CD81 molecule b n=1 Tax=Amphilophus citrinellus TaxID=61819 RepID=A0A3Q0RVH0_AMPCI
MAVTGCTKCIKYMLFFFNFIFWLAGGVILGVALWLRHDSQTSNLLILQFEDHQAPGTFYISVYILIAVGAVMMLVGFLGCYGAIQESQCLLGTFFFFLVILFACEVAAAIWGFMNRDTVCMICTQVKHDHAMTIKAFSECLGVHEMSSPGFDCRLSSQFLAIQSQRQKVLIHHSDMFSIHMLPLSPCQSCHSKLIELFSEKLYLIGLAALVVAVIMIFEMIFTMVLCCGIRNSPGVY